jgi:cytochrome c
LIPLKELISLHFHPEFIQLKMNKNSKRTLTIPFKGNPISCTVFSLLLLFIACSKPVPDAGKPEDNRYTKVILTQGMDEPMAMTFLEKGRILIVERKGGVKIFDNKTGEIKQIATIPVNTKYTTKEGVVTAAEEGLIGVIAHPGYAQNHWIYLYYADPVDTKHVLARFELHDDSLYTDTKKVILEVATQREVCCHTGGGMVFDKQGNLFLTVGNNTANPASGTSSYDERPGRESWDDQRGSGNSNDLRGKILRIHPEDDGSYTIPEGNLFAKGTPKTRPEIYIMGDRNPWRVSVDSKTGYLYWGEVGPDASADSVWGPRGYDEFNQARKAGYFGWPYFIGDNQPYAKYDYVNNTYGEKFDPAHPVNNSVNNTGLKDLPLPEKAFIWYPYGVSDTFPLLGSSGRSAVGGPVFHQDDFKDAKRPWSSYYENKWLITDFMRGWIMAVSMDQDGHYKSMEPVLPDQNFSSVIDMQFSPEGDLYVLEYGSAWFRGNANSALVRMEFNNGNRKPSVQASASRLAGAVPFQVSLSSAGTVDFDPYDKDKLTYEWKVSGPGLPGKTFTDPNPVVTLEKPGVYSAVLTVTDTRGEKNLQVLTLSAGNEPPQVSLDILKGNKTFFFQGESLEYAIGVNDKEDGSTSDGKIKSDEVAVNFDYVPEGFDPIEIAQNHRAADERAGFAPGLYLINSSDCKSCHSIDKTSVGPSYVDVANKYKTDAEAKTRLAAKVIQGGSGVWGEHAMSAHPSITKEESEVMVGYILSLNQKQVVKPIPLKGTFTTKSPAGDNGNGGFLLRAAYTDKGSGDVASQSVEKIVALRNSSVDPKKAEKQKNTRLLTTPYPSFSLIGDGSYLGFTGIDLTQIKEIEFLVGATPQSGDAGGLIEVHLDSPEGTIIGQTIHVDSKPIDFARLMENMGGGAGKKGGQKARPTAANIDFSKLALLLATRITAKISKTDSVHDVYFVFRNPKAPATQPLVQAVEIHFHKESGSK